MSRRSLDNSLPMLASCSACLRMASAMRSLSVHGITDTLIRRNIDSLLDRIASGETSFIRLGKGIWDYERKPELSLSVDKIPCGIFVTEALRHDNIRKNSETFRKAKQAEISGLSEGGTWKIVDENDVPRKAYIIGATFGNLLKNAGTAY